MKESTKRVTVAIAVVLREGRILICQRRQQDSFGGYWEFPGGKLETGEELEACVRREIREELDLVIRPIDALAAVRHEYPGLDLTLHPFLCECVANEPRAIGCQALRWVLPRELGDYRFPPASEPIIAEIQRRLERRNPATGSPTGIDLSAEQV
ncbi:MAG TPA: 8-oxo-dGTP diphosphatase MutT [Tepidisphaeraceae bacterium]|nr:8-oxo-dGTP diphosphatase MutT [Tepidisphaeraceae bacterium]